MRRLPAALFAAVLSAGFVLAQDAAPLTPADAAKKLDQKVTVEFVVKSTGGKTAVYLNSEEDFKSDKNLTLFVPAKAVEKSITTSTLSGISEVIGTPALPTPATSPASSPRRGHFGESSAATHCS